jgi:hypothetical protein
LHHAHATGRFNVFLPIFDWVIALASTARARGPVERDLH